MSSKRINQEKSMKLDDAAKRFVALCRETHAMRPEAKAASVARETADAAYKAALATLQPLRERWSALNEEQMAVLTARRDDWEARYLDLCAQEKAIDAEIEAAEAIRSDAFDAIQANVSVGIVLMERFTALTQAKVMVLEEMNHVR